MLLLKHEKLHYSSLRNLRSVFDQMDINGDGVLQADELGVDSGGASSKVSTTQMIHT